MKYLILFLLFATTALGQLQVTNPPARVTLAWDRSTDPTVVGYNVYWGAQTKFYTNLLNAGNNTSCTISNLARGVTYYFAATCYTSTGLESEFSNEVSATTPAVPRPIVLRLSASFAGLLQGTGEAYGGYTVERTADFTAWADVGEAEADGSGQIVTQAAVPVGTNAFYRMRQN